MIDETKAANIAAAAAAQTLVLGNRTFIVPVPTLADFFAQRAEARRQVQAAMSDPLELLNKKITEAEKRNKPFSPTMVKALTESALAAATSQDTKQEPTDAQLHDQVTRPAMLYWWLWYLVKKADASITLAEVVELCPGDAIYAMSAKIGELMSLANLNPI